MITRRVAMFLSVAMLVVSPAFAGGNGGTKRTTTIKFVNNSSQTVGVTDSANNAAIQAAFAAKSSSQFVAAGGQVINSGNTATFTVLAGTFYVAAADSAFDTPITETINVASGQTYTITIVNSGTTIAFQ